MPSFPKVLSGTVITRQWEPERGLTEISQSFKSLDELYAICLETTDPHLVDRLVIDGLDANGQQRLLTFVFQSMAVSSGRR